MCIIVVKSIDQVKMHQHDKSDQKYIFITLMGFHRKMVTTVLVGTVFNISLFLEIVLDIDRCCFSYALGIKQDSNNILKQFLYVSGA